jgi:HK97 family phage major capsid protein
MNKAELEAQAKSLLAEGKLDEAKKVIEQLEALKDETPAENEERAEDKAEAPKDEVKKEESKEEPKDEPKDEVKDEPKEEPKKEERSIENAKGEDIDMEKVKINGKELAEPVTEQRAFLDYVTSKSTSVKSFNETRAVDDGQVKSTDAEAIIPEDIITKARKLPDTVVDLRNKVNSIKVKTSGGKYPILKSTTAKMVTVEELAKNPALAKPEFEEVPYNVSTYRGQIVVSQESLDDSADDLAGIIADSVQRQGLNTTNFVLANLLKTATAVPATSLDDIKTQINTGFDPAYGLELIVTQSFYNAVDIMKDGDGRYLLQTDITAQSGKSLFGVPVTVLKDEMLGNKGNKGDKVAFLGDPVAFATFFNRAETTARWIDHEIYGQYLAIFMRFDAKVVDPAAGKFITLTPAP